MVCLLRLGKRDREDVMILDDNFGRLPDEQQHLLFLALGRVHCHLPGW